MTDATLPALPAPTPIRNATMDMLRSVLMGLGTPLLARGLVNGDQLGAIVGGLLALASAVWSYLAAHPGKQNPLVMLLGLVRAAGAQKAWNGDVRALDAALIPLIEQRVDAAIRAKAGILAGPVDSIANHEITDLAAKGAAAVSLPLPATQGATS